MAYDLELAERIRDQLADQPELSERKMFGGLAFMVNGHMTVVASGQGGLMVRLDQNEAADLEGSTPAEPVIMKGREMKGWLRIPSSQLMTDDELLPWVEAALRFNTTLTPK